MSRKNTLRNGSLAISATTMLLCSAAFTSAGTDFCPTPGGTIGTPVVVDSWKDQKGGTWTLTCTNESTSGDFVWTYQGAAPGSPKKVIGRCVYVGGQNSTGVVPGPTGNDDYWWHTCFDPNPIAPGKYRAIIDIFCKNECEHSRRYMEYCDGEWVEVDRRDTSAEDFENQDPTDSNGDTIPDEGKLYLTEDLYGPGEPPPLPAEFETRVTLESDFLGFETMLFWNPGIGFHDMAPGDVLTLENVPADTLTWLDPRFIAVDGPIGVEIHPLELVPLDPGSALAILDQPVPFDTRYSLGNPNAYLFVNSAFNAPLPLEAFGFSNDLNFTDSPVHGLTSGEIHLGPPVIPACPGDSNGDNVVDFNDLNDVLSNWNTPGPIGDVDGSGFVDFDDLNLVLANWSTVCIPATD